MQRVAVSRILSEAPESVRDGHFSRPAEAERPRKGVRLIPGNGFAEAKRVRRHAPPVLSCTTRGFSCPAGYPAGGGLLPRLFTLTLEEGLKLTPEAALGRFVFCDTVRDGPLSKPAPACSMRRVVCWCSDFPLAKPVGNPKGLPATIRHPLRSER